MSIMHSISPFFIQDIHMELEAKIAKFHNRDDTILYASCFDANAGLFEVLTGQQDAIFSDQLNHASIIDGIRLAKTQKFRYKHKGETTVLNLIQCAKKKIISILKNVRFFW